MVLAWSEPIEREPLSVGLPSWPEKLAQRSSSICKIQGVAGIPGVAGYAYQTLCGSRLPASIFSLNSLLCVSPGSCSSILGTHTSFLQLCMGHTHFGLSAHCWRVTSVPQLILMSYRHSLCGSHSILVLAGIELIFFPGAGTVLCFQFRIRIILLTHWWFSCC